MYDLIVTNARIHPMSDGLGAVEAPSIGVRDGRIADIGVAPDAGAREVVDAGGRVLLPGFVDCHTHAVYAGNRMDEHALKLRGASYEEIARAGGGILSTVDAVRKASVDELVAQSRPRLDALLAEGVTTAEVKSGYGLDTENELKMLRAVAAIDGRTPQALVPGFLGAHAIPAGGSADDYMEEVIGEMLPAVAEEKLADCVDIFVEKIAFSVAHMERLFERAAEYGLHRRVHADQLSNQGASRRAAELGALSCDHLEYTDQADAQAMADNGTVGVLLPGAFYFLRETRTPPVELFRRLGVPMAVSTDVNPGSSPVDSLLAVLHMACIFFGLTAEEALLGVTRHAARAVGREHDRGTIEPGKRADFALWDIPGPEFLVYQLGGVRPDHVFIEGKTA